MLKQSQTVLERGETLGVENDVRLGRRGTKRQRVWGTGSPGLPCLVGLCVERGCAGGKQVLIFTWESVCNSCAQQFFPALKWKLYPLSL